MLSFNVTGITPRKIEQELFGQKKEKVVKGDLQERLRTNKPGQEDARAYELLCVDILKYLFSENIEFFDEQTKSNDGLYRFDFCGKIRSNNTSEFFDTVQSFFVQNTLFSNLRITKRLYHRKKYTLRKNICTKRH